MSESGANERSVLERSQWPSQYRAYDEISLFDLWAILANRKWQVAIVFSLIMGLAVAYVFLRHRTYTYTTAIQIGTYINKGSNGERKQEFVEPPSAVEQKLRQVFIPIARQEMDRPHKPALKVTASTEKDGGLFLLQTKARKSDADKVARLQQSIVSQLLKAHAEILNPIQKKDQLRVEKARNELSYIQSDAIKTSRLQPHQQKIQSLARQLAAMAAAYKKQHLTVEDQIASAKRQLAALEDARTLMQGKEKRIGEKEELVKEQLKEQQNMVNQLQKTRLQAIDQTRASADAMTLLMVGTQVDQAQHRIDRLTDKLRVGLPQTRDNIVKSLADNGRAQKNAKTQLVSLKEQLNKLEGDYRRKRESQQSQITAAKTAYQKAQADYQQAVSAKKREIRAAQTLADQDIPTRALFTAIPSTSPTGPSSSLILILGCILGLMIAIFCAFVFEFIARANSHVAKLGSSSAVDRLERETAVHLTMTKENVSVPNNPALLEE